MWSFLFYSYFILRRKKDVNKRLEDEKNVKDDENVSGLESKNDIRLRQNKVQDVKDDSWSLFLWSYPKLVINPKFVIFHEGCVVVRLYSCSII